MHPLLNIFALGFTRRHFAIVFFSEILKKERDVAQTRYGNECYERLKETLAFGSRVPTTESNVSGCEMVSLRGVTAKSPQSVQKGIYSMCITQV